MTKAPLHLVALAMVEFFSFWSGCGVGKKGGNPPHLCSRAGKRQKIFVTKCSSSACRSPITHITSSNEFVDRQAMDGFTLLPPRSRLLV